MKAQNSGLALNRETKRWFAGTRTLAAPELEAVLAALVPVTITAGAPCGADKPLATITVTTPAGARKYTDDFYSCQGGGETYVGGIDTAFAAIRAQAHR